MSYEILEHTGDVRLKASGDTKDELFREAMKGMMEVLNPKSKVQSPKQRVIKIQSSDINSLLVDFLSEVNYMRQVHQEAYESVRFLKFSDTELEAELEGYVVENFGEDIKAVTFHDLHVQKNSEGHWETFVVFDV